MGIGKNAHQRRNRVAPDTLPRLRTLEGMAPWRWLLFAVMARFEVGEDVYLQIPSARLTPGDAPTKRSHVRFGEESLPGVKIP